MSRAVPRALDNDQNSTYYLLVSHEIFTSDKANIISSTWKTSFLRNAREERTSFAFLLFCLFVYLLFTWDRKAPEKTERKTESLDPFQRKEKEIHNFQNSGNSWGKRQTSFLRQISECF